MPKEVKKSFETSSVSCMKENILLIKNILVNKVSSLKLQTKRKGEDIRFK